MESRVSSDPLHSSPPWNRCVGNSGPRCSRSPNTRPGVPEGQDPENKPRPNGVGVITTYNCSSYFGGTDAVNLMTPIIEAQTLRHSYWRENVQRHLHAFSVSPCVCYFLCNALRHFFFRMSVTFREELQT